MSSRKDCAEYQAAYERNFEDSGRSSFDYQQRFMQLVAAVGGKKADSLKQKKARNALLREIAEALEKQKDHLAWFEQVLDSLLEAKRASSRR